MAEPPSGWSRPRRRRSRKARIVRYGAAAAVPSALDEPPTARFTVELLADDWPDDLARMLAGPARPRPGGDPGRHRRQRPGARTRRPAWRPVRPDLAPVAGSGSRGGLDERPAGPCRGPQRRPPPGRRRDRRPRRRLDRADRRPADPARDRRSPTPAVAVAGGFGLVSADLRRFEDAAGPDVDAIELDWLAFRRADFAALGPLDEKFAFHRHLDVWWSLVLRAGAGDGQRAAGGAAARPAAGAPRPSRLGEPARGRARPPLEAQLLPGPGPLPRPAGPPAPACPSAAGRPDPGGLTPGASARPRPSAGPPVR